MQLNTVVPLGVLTHRARLIPILKPLFLEVYSDFSIPSLLGVVAPGTSLSIAGAGRRFWLDTQATQVQILAQHLWAPLHPSAPSPLIPVGLGGGEESHHSKGSLERTRHLLMICPTSPLDPGGSPQTPNSERPRQDQRSLDPLPPRSPGPLHRPSHHTQAQQPRKKDPVQKMEGQAFPRPPGTGTGGRGST